MKTNTQNRTKLWWHYLQCKDVHSTAATKHNWRLAKSIFLWFVVIICGSRRDCCCFCKLLLMFHRQFVGDLQSIWRVRVYMQETGVLMFANAVINQVLSKLLGNEFRVKWKQIKVFHKNKSIEKLIYSNSHKSLLVNQWKTVLKDNINFIFNWSLVSSFFLSTSDINSNKSIWMCVCFVAISALFRFLFLLF